MKKIKNATTLYQAKHNLKAEEKELEWSIKKDWDRIKDSFRLENMNKQRLSARSKKNWAMVFVRRVLNSLALMFLNKSEKMIGSRISEDHK